MPLRGPLLNLGRLTVYYTAAHSELSHYQIITLANYASSFSFDYISSSPSQH